MEQNLNNLLLNFLTIFKYTYKSERKRILKKKKKKKKVKEVY